MDPNAALQGYVDAIADGDYDQAYDFLEALEGWLRGGGFLPRGVSDDRRAALSILVYQAKKYVGGQVLAGHGVVAD